jgi:outer membrane lipoprotein SlyB
MPFDARFALVALCLWLMGAFAAHANPAPAAEPFGSGETAATVFTNGWVRSIEPIAAAQETPYGAGAMVGGVIGAIVGRQMADSSHGKNLGSAIGAAAGALIGHEIEKSARRDRAGVRITVTLDDGSVRRFDFKESGGLRVGDRVRVEGQQLYRVG